MLVHPNWEAGRGTLGHCPLAYSDARYRLEGRKQEPQCSGTGELRVKVVYECPIAAVTNYHHRWLKTTQSYSLTVL